MKTLNIVAFAALAFGQNTVLAQEPAAVKDSSSVFASAMVQLKAQGDTTRPPADFVAVEKEPVIIYKKEPVYPEIAKKAGMEGMVWVKVWVGADGKPHQVLVLQSTADVFSQAAVDAAWAFRFEPALMHGKAVDVWVSFPFKFAMAQKDAPGQEFPQSYNSMRDFIRDVLQGKSIKDEQIKAIVDPEASAIAGGDSRSLVDAIRGQQKGEQILEQANREISFTSFYLNDRRDASMMVVKTTVKGKKPIPHFHTVVAYRASNGEWKIRHWHAWR